MTEFNLFSLTIAQQPVPQIPVEGSPPPPAGTTTAPGNGTGAPAGTGSPPAGPNIMVLVMLMIVVMLIFTIWSSRRDRKKREALISSVKKHDRVQTIGGVIGSVVEVKPDYIVLKVDESSNTRITFARSAVQQVLTSSPDLGAKEQT